MLGEITCLVFQFQEAFLVHGLHPKESQQSWAESSPSVTSPVLIPFSTFKDLCDYIGPTQIIQNKLPI